MHVKAVQSKAVADCRENIQSERSLMTLESKLFRLPSVYLFMCVFVCACLCVCVCEGEKAIACVSAHMLVIFQR